MSATDGTEATPPKTRRSWVIGLSVLCAILLLYGAVKTHPTPDIAFTIGASLLPALILAALTWAVSRDARHEKGIVFGCIFASLVLGNYLGVLREREQANDFLDRMKSTTRSYAEQAIVDPDSLPKPVDIRPAVATAQGDTGKAEVVIKEMLNEFAAAHNAYLAEIQALGWYTLLDAKRLRKDTSLEESWSIVKGGERIARKYQQHSLDLIDAMPEKVKQAAFRSERSRESMLQGFKASQPKARQNARELWALEFAAIDEMRGIVQLLDHQRGHYQVSDTQVLFKTHADLAAYNKHIEELGRIGRQQQVLQQRMMEATAADLERTRKSL